MRAMEIRVFSEKGGLSQMKTSFRKNWLHYLQEALGLGIFMLSACFFGAMLEATSSSWHLQLPNDFERLVIMGILMGLTALFIFYSPLTAPSGSHINPAVSITFLRLGRMCKWDVFFYIIFQCIGAVTAVYLMVLLMGNKLSSAPVNCVVTVPGKYGTLAAALAELLIAFVMISMVLFTAENEKLKKYTRIIAACFVCLYVIIAGPVSGFGMNPARSLASALAAHCYRAFWIYIIMPFAGMLTAAEFFLLIKKDRIKN